MESKEYRIVSYYEPETGKSIHVPQRKFFGFFWWDLFCESKSLEEAEFVIHTDSIFTESR